MTDPFHLGQGPRPDLLEQELKLRAEQREAEEKGHTALPPKEKESSEDKETKETKKPETEEKPEYSWKDRLAMIIAMFQLVFPWIGLAILIYFLFTFLITRI